MIEDNPADAFLIRQAIVRAEIAADVQILEDGHDAKCFIDRLDEDDEAIPPDVILLDLNLPRMGGDEFLQHLRGSRRCAQVTVIVTTSSEDVRDLASITGLHIAGWFTKPSDLAEFMKLGELIRQLLEEKSRGASL